MPPGTLQPPSSPLFARTKPFRVCTFLLAGMDATGDAAVSGPASTAGDDDEPLSGGRFSWISHRGLWMLHWLAALQFGWLAGRLVWLGSKLASRCWTATGEAGQLQGCCQAAQQARPRLECCCRWMHRIACLTVRLLPHICAGDEAISSEEE